MRAFANYLWFQILLSDYGVESTLFLLELSLLIYHATPALQRPLIKPRYTSIKEFNIRNFIHGALACYFRMSSAPCCCEPLDVKDWNKNASWLQHRLQVQSRSWGPIVLLIPVCDLRCEEHLELIRTSSVQQIHVFNHIYETRTLTYNLNPSGSMEKMYQTWVSYHICD
jgi:hypothetical protein